MSKQYSKQCSFCKAQIKMSDESGVWKPYNTIDNKIHECKKQNSSVPTNSNWSGNDISVEVLLKKLESIGVSINLDRLRNTVNGNGN